MKPFSPMILVVSLILSIVCVIAIALVTIPESNDSNPEIERLEKEIDLLQESIVELQKRVEPKAPPPSQLNSLKMENFIPNRKSGTFPSGPPLNIDDNPFSREDYLFLQRFHDEIKTENLFPEMKNFDEIDSYIQHIDDDTWIYLYSPEYREKMKEKRYNIEIKK